MRKKIDEYSKDELIEIVKSLRRRKKFGLVWEDKPENVVLQCQNELPVVEEQKRLAMTRLKNAPTNLIIEGDNYHSLSILNYTHSGKVDLIYIDPPFNTGASKWIYNNNYVDGEDVFRHSKWLSFMARRLMLAKTLLKDDGALICAIDDNEQAHLGVLIEEIFTKFETHTITVVHNPKGVQGSNFSYTHEYAIFIIPKNRKTVIERKLREEEIYWSNLRNWGGESLRTDARNCFYPVIVKNKKIIGFGDVSKDDFHPNSSNVVQRDGTIYIYPIDQQGIERKWRYARQSVEGVIQHLRVKENGKGSIEIIIGKDFGAYKTVWLDKRYDASEYGTKLLKKILPESNFDFPKSLYTVYDCIDAVVGNKKDSIVLDYFAGSGTTGHAVLELNKKDKGNRQFILCTNNENNIAEEVTYPRIKNVIQGYSDVKGIPANLRYFKTTFVDRQQSDDQTRAELVARSTDMISMREDSFETVLSNKSFHLYKGFNKYCGIIFNPDKISDFKSAVRKQNIDMPLDIYVFSLSNDTYSSDFVDLEEPHELCPIPESILEVYRRIASMRSINE